MIVVSAATAAHAADVTTRLRDDEPPLGLTEHEAICPRCTLAYFVREGAFSWGVCRDCVGEALVVVPV